MLRAASFFVLKSAFPISHIGAISLPGIIAQHQDPVAEAIATHGAHVYHALSMGRPVDALAIIHQYRMFDCDRFHGDLVDWMVQQRLRLDCFSAMIMGGLMITAEAADRAVRRAIAAPAWARPPNDTVILLVYSCNRFYVGTNTCNLLAHLMTTPRLGISPEVELAIVVHCNGELRWHTKEAFHARRVLYSNGYANFVAGIKIE